MQRPANIDTLDHVLLKDVSADNDDHNSSAKSSSLDGEPGDHVIIKSGKFVNCLARISSKGTSNNRYNLQILTDDGVPLRRHDNALKCTALVRSGFDVLGVPSHQDAEGQSIVDIVAVTAELKKRRLELNLPDFTPSIAAKRSNASISASGMVGSPMSKSKLKIKGNTQDETDGNSAEGDGGESRYLSLITISC